MLLGSRGFDAYRLEGAVARAGENVYVLQQSNLHRCQSFCLLFPEKRFLVLVHRVSTQKLRWNQNWHGAWNLILHIMA